VKDGTVRPDVLAKWAANAPLAFIDQYAGNLRQYRAGYSGMHTSAEADRFQNHALPFQQESLL
jgi:hypothetical protein